MNRYGNVLFYFPSKHGKFSCSGVILISCLQINTWRRARLTCCVADMSVGGRLLIFGWAFFLLNNVNLKLLRDSIIFPQYKWERKSIPAFIQSTSSASDSVNTCRLRSNFSNKLRAEIFSLPNGYDTVSQPDSQYQRTKGSRDRKIVRHSVQCWICCLSQKMWILFLEAIF